MEKIKTDQDIKRSSGLSAIPDSAKKADKPRRGEWAPKRKSFRRTFMLPSDRSGSFRLCESRDETGKACLPVFMSSRLYIDFTNEDEFEEKYDRLLRTIFEKPELKKPPLGKPPAYLFQPQ